MTVSSGIPELLGPMGDVLAVYGPGEGFVFHFLFYSAYIDIPDALCGTNECDGYDKAA